MARKNDKDPPSDPGDGEDEREARKQRRIDAQMLAALYGADDEELDRFRQLRLGSESEVTHEDLLRARELLEAVVGALRDENETSKWQAFERAWAELTPDPFTDRSPDSVTDAGQSDDGDRPTTPPAPPVGQPSWPGAPGPGSDSGKTPTQQSTIAGQRPPGRTAPGHTAPAAAPMLGSHTPSHGQPAWPQPAVPGQAAMPGGIPQQAGMQGQAAASPMAAQGNPAAMWGQAYAPGSLPPHGAPAGGAVAPQQPHHPGALGHPQRPQGQLNAPTPAMQHAPASPHATLPIHPHAGVQPQAPAAGMHGMTPQAPMHHQGAVPHGGHPGALPHAQQAHGTQPLAPHPPEVGAYLQRQRADTTSHATTPHAGTPPVAPSSPGFTPRAEREPTPPLFSTQKVGTTTDPAPNSRRLGGRTTTIDDETPPPSDRTDPHRAMAPADRFDPTATIAMSPGKRTTKTTELSFGSSTHAFAMTILEYAALCAQRDADPDNVQRIERKYDVYDDRVRDAVDRAFELRFEDDEDLEEEFKQAYARYKVLLAEPEGQDESSAN